MITLAERINGQFLDVKKAIKEFIKIKLVPTNEKEETSTTSKIEETSTINKIEEIITIMNETIKELVKKKGKPFLFALFLFCTLFI